MNKICPIMSSVYQKLELNEMYFQECCGKDCALWVMNYQHNETGELVKSGYCGLLSKK